MLPWWRVPEIPVRNSIRNENLKIYDFKGEVEMLDIRVELSIDGDCKSLGCWTGCVMGPNQNQHGESEMNGCGGSEWVKTCTRIKLLLKKQNASYTNALWRD